MIDAVKKLREKTNAGIVACQKALRESGGDIDKAVEILRKQILFKESVPRATPFSPFRLDTLSSIKLSLD